MRNYTLRDLCTIRVNKCAAEGSVIRLESFQSKLLKGNVCYEQGDPKFMYLDYEAMDGASLKFLFSDDRNETCDNDNCCITQARFIRIRFDLKFETPAQASRSVKFMNAFVDHCEALERIKLIPYHSINTSIRLYSYLYSRWKKIRLFRVELLHISYDVPRDREALNWWC